MTKYLYADLIDDPHELCLWAKEEIEKEYKKSCTKAILDVSAKIKQRAELNEEALDLINKLKTAHADGDRFYVAELLDSISSNVRK